MKKITMITIAEELGVSKSTVSRAFVPDSEISDKVRNRILNYAKSVNYVPNRAASRLSMDETHICVLYPEGYGYAVDEFTAGIAEGFKEKHDLKVSIDYVTYKSEEMTPKALRLTLEGLTEYDGVIINGFTGEDKINILNEYAEGGMKFAVLQSDIPELKKVFSSCLDTHVSTMMAAEFIHDCLREGRKSVALFTGDRESPLHKKATDIFSKAAIEYGFDIAASYDMKDNPSILKNQVSEMYERNGICPDAIYITSGESLELCKYIKEHNLSGRTVLVTFDVYPALSEYIKDGTVRASIYQNHFKQGKNAVTNLIDSIIYNKKIQPIISPVPELVMRSNLPCYLR